MTRPMHPVDQKLFMLTVTACTLLAVVIMAAIVMNDQAKEIDRLKQRINAQNNVQMDVVLRVAWMFNTNFKDAQKRMCKRFK